MLPPRASLAQQQQFTALKEKKTVEEGDTGVATGMVVNTSGFTNPKRGAGTGRVAAEPTRLEYVMSKYQKRTEDAVKKREERAGKTRDKGPRAIREKLPQSVKDDAKASALGCFKRLSSCISTCWNGPKFDEKAELDKAPIIFGGIYRRVMERSGGACAAPSGC